MSGFSSFLRKTKPRKVRAMDLARSPKRTRRKYSCGGNNKACLILYCLGSLRDEDGKLSVLSKIDYNIFIVDVLKSDVVGPAVDDNGFALASPTFQIDCGVCEFAVSDGFCVLGEKLYMFEGCVDKDGSRKSVFAIDLTTQNPTQETRKLEKGGPLLSKVSEMKFPKAEPVAIPTPDGEKIVVFPTFDFDEDDECVFELFEPAKGSWEQLPSITGGCEPIYVYGFVQKSLKLVIQMFDGMRVLDLAAPSADRRWEIKQDIIHPGVELIPPIVDYSSFFETVEDGRFCFVNGYGLYDLKEYVGAYRRKDVDFLGFAPNLEKYQFGMRDDSHFYLDFCLARCLNNDERDEKTGEYHFCQLIMERPLSASARSCRMSMIVCCVDLKSYVKRVRKLPLRRLCSSSLVKRDKVTVRKVYKFSLHFDGGGRKVYRPHLFFTF